MTLLLAGVRGAEEAETALALGADIIDLADAAGGALEPDVVRAAVRTIAGRRPVSAAIGDRPMRPDAMEAAAAAMAATGVQFVKVGLVPGPEREDCVRRMSALARTTKLVGVLFADLEPGAGGRGALVRRMGEAGFAGATLDARQGAGRLLDRMDVAALADFVEACRAQGLLAGLAGSLEPPDIPRLLPLAPDFLGFRGALCRGGDRTAPLDPAAFRLVRELIPPEPAAVHGGSAETTVDYRLLAARAHAPDPDTEEGARNRIFVRDFVLPVRVGAYAHERDKLQRVRFNVDVDVLRPAHPTEDMRDVFSYDVVTDGIRMIVAHEHIALLETLAERIAALVLAYARVSGVTVRVEKLDVGPGAVGVEIRRERAAEAANVRHLYPVATARTDKAGE
jgi:FolB domain-containing protein